MDGRVASTPEARGSGHGVQEMGGRRGGGGECFYEQKEFIRKEGWCAYGFCGGEKGLSVSHWEGKCRGVVGWELLGSSNGRELSRKKWKWVLKGRRGFGRRQKKQRMRPVAE